MLGIEEDKEWMVARIKGGTEDDLIKTRSCLLPDSTLPINVDVFRMALIHQEKVLLCQVCDLINKIYREKPNANKLLKPDDYIFFACKLSPNPETLKIVFNEFREELPNSVPLHYCIMWRKFDLLVNLLDNLKFYKLDINKQDLHGMTPLHWAAETGEKYYDALVARKASTGMNEMILNNDEKTPAEVVLRRSDDFFAHILKTRINDIPEIVTKRVYDYLVTESHFTSYPFPPYEKKDE